MILNCNIEYNIFVNMYSKGFILKGNYNYLNKNVAIKGNNKKTQKKLFIKRHNKNRNILS
jgi:hypothetical protein